MGIISFLVFGLIVGIIANLVDPRPEQGGILGTVVLGIVGAVVGGWLGGLIFNVPVTGFNISSFFVAIGGSLLVLFIARTLTRSSAY